VLSELTLEELASAPEAVRRVLDAVPDANIELVNVTEEARALASAYIEAGAVGPGSGVDALHNRGGDVGARRGLGKLELSAHRQPVEDPGVQRREPEKGLSSAGDTKPS
jgi:hypothetical protein